MKSVPLHLVTFSDFNHDGVISPRITSGTPTPYDSEITSENHYYPFGLSHTGPWYARIMPENRYLYNGKELMPDFGLNWHAYGYRHYDMTLGRFTGVDPIADQFSHLSTFNYAGNNPIVNIDLHGLQGVKYYDANTNTTTFNLNVVMIVGTKGAYESGLSVGDKKMVEDALNLMFGGIHTDKSGEKFQFTFNVSVVDFSTKEEKINRKGEVVTKEKPTEIAFREIGLIMKGNSQETIIENVPSFPFL